MDRQEGTAWAIGTAAAERPRPHGWGPEVILTGQVLPELGGRLRVLVADDCADAADSMALLLKHWGHEVLTAYAAGEALALALAHHPDVMLLDVGMPGGDGLALARAVRRQPCLAGVLLVAVTGYADHAHRRLGVEAGFDHYLAKPAEPAVIEALLLLAAGVKKAHRAAVVAARK